MVSRVRMILYYLTTWLPVPDALALTAPARFAERFLTKNYRLQRHAMRYLPQDVVGLVDIGCGGAVYLVYAPPIPKIGIDINPKRLRVAEKYCNIVLLRDITLGLDGIEAPAALCFEVIEHLSETEGERLLKGLKRFPIVILTTPRKFFSVNRCNWEKHKSLWLPEKLYEYGYVLHEEVDTPPSNIYVRA